MQNPNNLIWIDLEMTGLEPERDVIIEMATIVTDSELNVLAEGPVIAIHQSDETLAGMDEWNTRTHGQSGLTQRVRESRIDTATAEAQTIAFLEQWVPKGKSPICGNSIGQDRRFLYKYMPPTTGDLNEYVATLRHKVELRERRAVEAAKGRDRLLGA
ncbi:oligoribonuclease, partial [Ectopseudomonas hydrolytica]|uniref:oligoribonuclease n=1 Tax=Ectopseudomonas hydrolytica TaxID=2493633 RepID=UPI003C2D939E